MSDARGPAAAWTAPRLAARIQHTLVAPDARDRDVRALCEACLQHRFDGAMVQPCWVPLARAVLGGSGVKVCTAFGYPMGGDGTFAKAAAARDAVARGAEEIDFMPNLGYLKSGFFDRYLMEIRAVVEAAEGRPVKAMLELGLLDPEEGRRAAELAVEAGAHYVKNSSGYGGGGQASEAIARQLVGWVGGRAKVKLSGGIRTARQAAALLEAGADLLGTSAGVAIVAGEGAPSGTPDGAAPPKGGY